ncbi:hypothetical protein N7475_000274 [Penicillium sp. IBT 31633x]|nr:hypothetical protein N7475_000274 [Penicillium sp. IBT 31633x]
MAHSILPYTHENSYCQASKNPHWIIPESLTDETGNNSGPQYEIPPSDEILASTSHNDLGFNVLHIWPTLHDGTASPHGVPDWWNPPIKVDVLISGGGPSGLEVALSCLRQGLTFRIIDKNSSPLVAGRADGVQPRFLETLSTWGPASNSSNTTSSIQTPFSGQMSTGFGISSAMKSNSQILICDQVMNTTAGFTERIASAPEPLPANYGYFTRYSHQRDITMMSIIWN